MDLPALISGSGYEGALALVLIVSASAVTGLALHLLLFRGVLAQLARVPGAVGLRSIRRHCAAPSRALLPLLVFLALLPAAEGVVPAAPWLSRAGGILAILSGAWLLTRLTAVLRDVLLDRFRIDVADNLRARRIHTQIEIIRKLLIVAVSVLAAASVLMSFERLRDFGTGMLASAGLAGIVLGLAAQKTLGNLLAGVQIGLTQPIRLDDVVVVEGEWGRVEEITLTYVVVRIWDERRLVLPISYFLDNPFQNWTRVSADILGTVFVYVDYTVPFEEVRRELGRIVEASEHWDGRVWRLHVTEARERCVELRALMSAADSGAAWELRCEVREKLLARLKERYPEALPRVRAVVDRAA